jgi:hypothetical protein
MIFDMVIFGYLGPETMLPMTSAVAGVAGVVLLFGRSSLRWAFGTLKRLASMARPRPKPRAGARRIGKRPVGRIDSSSNEQERVQA